MQCKSSFNSKRYHSGSKSCKIICSWVSFIALSLIASCGVNTDTFRNQLAGHWTGEQDDIKWCMSFNEDASFTIAVLNRHPEQMNKPLDPSKAVLTVFPGDEWIAAEGGRILLKYSSEKMTIVNRKAAGESVVAARKQLRFLVRLINNEEMHYTLETPEQRGKIWFQSHKVSECPAIFSVGYKVSTTG